MILNKIVFFFLFFVVKPLFLYSQTPVLGSESFGKASYYGNKFYGRKTASGEILKKRGLTCAHPSLPFGTMLEVTNLANNKWCIVRVNDRGPFVRGRIVDVSYDAAKQLEMFKTGTAKVKVMVVGDNGIVMINRPESIIENSTELIGPPEEEDKITVITPPIVSKKYTPKPKKKKSKTKTPFQLGVKKKKNS
jgi:rare lipoprotein A